MTEYVRRVHKSRTGRRLLGILMRTPPGRLVAHVILARVRWRQDRRLYIEAIQELNRSARARDMFVAGARRRAESRPDDIRRFDVLILALIYSDDREQTLSILYSPAADGFLAQDPQATNIFGARVSLCHEMEHCRRALRETRRATDLAPELLRSRLDYLKSAFAAGKMLQHRDAIEFFGRQYMLTNDHPGRATDREIERIVEACARACMYTIKDYVEYLEYKDRKAPRIGVFFLSSTEALGHAVLDPYYFLALNRDRFDHVVFIGPPRDSYRPASRACLQIVEQYGDYIETTSDILLNLSWMSLGDHQIGSLTLVIDHYWSLLRAAVHRTRSESDGFRHNAWHFTLPPYYDTVGEQFCTRHGIDLERPLIVVHVRDSGYHQISRQSHRDSSVESYRAAVTHLLDRGYQVVRIGDKKMPKLKLEDTRYFELPFLKSYRHELDPFLICRSRFMIGCQSGPCAFARALGVPILTVNAVLHYTLLPSVMEMACFKRYYRVEGKQRVELSLIQALDARADQLDNRYHFEQAHIEVENADAEEILAAVRDMDAWVDSPQMTETAAQCEFRQRVEEQMVTLAAERDTLPIPIADYIGIALDGYRISPTVERMRS